MAFHFREFNFRGKDTKKYGMVKIGGAKKTYQQFINRFSTAGNFRFLHFFDRKMHILRMKLPK
jgi:hypothetical protein